MSSSSSSSLAEDLSNLGIDSSGLFSPQQVGLAKMLVEMGQSHMFHHWAGPGVDDDEKLAFFDQVSTGEVSLNARG